MSTLDDVLDEDIFRLTVSNMTTKIYDTLYNVHIKVDSWRTISALQIGIQFCFGNPKRKNRISTEKNEFPKEKFGIPQDKFRLQKKKLKYKRTI